MWRWKPGHPVMRAVPQLQKVQKVHKGHGLTAFLHFLQLLHC
jgi:hypothetical protein